MSEYKVPQDVEAEDKLIGPFSFRQFIYLIVAAIGGVLSWGLAQITVTLLVLPLPIILFFLILALPLRKDQPMEAYLLAMVQFFFKPHNRYWSPDGDATPVEITVPHVVEKSLIKDFSGHEASVRLTYLANVIDTGGWASRGVNSAMTDDAAMDASKTEDVFDEESGVGQSFDDLLMSSNSAYKQSMIDKLRQSIQSSNNPVTSGPSTLSQPSPTSTSDSAPDVALADNQPNDTVPRFDPYPNSMRQKVLRPAGQDTPNDTVPATPATSQVQSTDEPKHKPSLNTVSPDIIRLANNNDLSISAIARQAHRDDEQEVVISLR